MRYALVNNEKAEASSELKGVCLGCGQPMIAKCGEQRLHHWAHFSKRNCDSWWETETDWHRSWKSNFPVEWQEVFLPDEQTGEKHVADVKTEHGLVIEFQHSHIDPQERMSREKFYQNMVWVVDGTRLKRDCPRFTKAANDFRHTELQGFFSVYFPEECFPKNWLESSVPVIFDFKDASSPPQNIIQDCLWCLLPGRVGYDAIVVCISRKDFVERVLSNSQLFNDPPHKFIEAFNEKIRRQQQFQTNVAFRGMEQRALRSYGRRGNYRRRF